jgi:hypothetical protein
VLVIIFGVLSGKDVSNEVTLVADHFTFPDADFVAFSAMIRVFFEVVLFSSKLYADDGVIVFMLRNEAILS